MIDLKKLASARFKIQLDPSYEAGDHTNEEKLWCYQIPCKYGHIGVWGQDTLSGYTSRKRVIPKLESVPGVTVKQRGDSEMTVLFPPDLLDQVAEVLQARRKRRLSDEQRTANAERLSAYRYKVSDSAAQITKRG